jgi:phosphohistidine swiveling domain-containing protein
MSEQIFSLGYTRDYCMIMEDFWFKSQTTGLLKILGMKNPHATPNVFYMDRGMIEVWENETALAWASEAIKSRVLNDSKFLPDVISKYNGLNDRVIALGAELFKTKEQLLGFINLVSETCDYFTVWYLVATNNSLTNELRSPAFVVRDKDDFFASSSRAIRRGINEVLNIENKKAAAMLVPDIIAGVSDELLNKRFASWVYIPGIANETIGFNEFAKNNPQFQFEREKEEFAVNEVKGRAAFKGFARGIVKIVRLNSEADKVKEGDIIVSPMTVPDLVPAMKRAAAIVTDEGGVTCHAAIISRELKKPCVIGTKVATKIFKDGDMVEVDADKGVVKIIK